MKEAIQISKNFIKGLCTTIGLNSSLVGILGHTLFNGIRSVLKDFFKY